MHNHRVNNIFVALFLLGTLLITSCSTPNQPASTQTTVGGSALSQSYTGPINKPVTTTGCGRVSPVAAGSSANETIAVNPAVSEGFHSRMYRVHVPVSYALNHPQAVVLAFHGFGGDASGMDLGSGFSPLADQQDFIAVYPQGLPQGVGGRPFWASVGPIDFGVDDVLFVSDVLNDLQSKFCVDTHRIYVTGFSNGGGMSGFLACRLAGRIAAFAPLSGNFYDPPGGCHPGRPVPMLDFHGSADPLLPYNGIPTSQNAAWPLPSIPQWLQTWATRNGCTTGPTIFLRQPNATGEQWTGCADNATIVHYRIEHGGHAWPPAIAGQSADAIIWHFFQAHPLP
ncbi:MAG: PHB depolymerase family esterase [Ktedonobacteraceae bacterium]